MTQSVEVLKAFLGCFVEGRFDDAFELLADDIVVHHYSRLPYGGQEYRGKDAFRVLQGKIGAFWARFEPVPGQQIVPDGDAVAIVIGALSGTPQHIDRNLTIPVVERYRVAGGKIAEIWAFYIDTDLTDDHIGP